MNEADFPTVEFSKERVTLSITVVWELSGPDQLADARGDAAQALSILNQNAKIVIPAYRHETIAKPLPTGVAPLRAPK